MRRARPPVACRSCTRRSCAPQAPTSARPATTRSCWATGRSRASSVASAREESVRTAALGALRDGEAAAAAGPARCRYAVPGFAGRAGGGQPVPVRRRAGDLPRAAAAGAAGRGRRRHADRRRRSRALADGFARGTRSCPAGPPHATRLPWSSSSHGPRRAGRDPRGARRRASAISAWSPARGAAPAVLADWVSPRTSGRGSSTPAGSGSARARRRRSRCRSWPRSSSAIRLGGVTAPALPSRPAPAQALDPVCGMTVVVAAADAAPRRSTASTCWFCGTGCRDRSPQAERSEGGPVA